MVYRNEWVPSKMALLHLPRGFGRELQVNRVDVRFYPEIPRYPKSRNNSCIVMSECPRKRPYFTYPEVLVVNYK